MLTADQRQLLIAGLGFWVLEIVSFFFLHRLAKGKTGWSVLGLFFCFHFHIGAAVYGVGFGGGSLLEEVVEFHAAIDRI